VKLVVGGAGSKDYIKKVMDGDKIVSADVTYAPSMIADAMKLTAEARVEGTCDARHDDHSVGADDQGERGEVLLPRLRRSERCRAFRATAPALPMLGIGGPAQAARSGSASPVTRRLRAEAFSRMIRR
jgi:hypothetical protein